MSITNQLVHPGHGPPEPFSNGVQRNDLHIGSEHIRGSGDRTHITYLATSQGPTPSATGQKIHAPRHPIKIMTHPTAWPRRVVRTCHNRGGTVTRRLAEYDF